MLIEGSMTNKKKYQRMTASNTQKSKIRSGKGSSGVLAVKFAEYFINGRSLFLGFTCEAECCQIISYWSRLF